MYPSGCVVFIGAVQAKTKLSSSCNCIHNLKVCGYSTSASAGEHYYPKFLYTPSVYRVPSWHKGLSIKVPTHV